jgi:hypothetical protein
MAGEDGEGRALNLDFNNRRAYSRAEALFAFGSVGDGDRGHTLNTLAGIASRG